MMSYSHRSPTSPLARLFSVTVARINGATPADPNPNRFAATGASVPAVGPTTLCTCELSGNLAKRTLRAIFSLLATK